MTQQDFRPLANRFSEPSSSYRAIAKNPLIEEDNTMALFNKQLGDVTVEDFVLIIPLNEIIELCMHNRNEIITESVYKVLDELMKVYHLDKNNTIQQMNEEYFIRMFTRTKFSAPKASHSTTP